MTRLLVLGDSLSDGFHRRDPQGLGSAWPAALVRLVPDLGVENHAHGGDRSVEALAVARSLEAVGEPWSLAIVMIGANDLWRRWVPWNNHAAVDEEDYRRNLIRIVQALQPGVGGQVWLASPCLLHQEVDHPWNRELATYREVCREAAQACGAGYLPVGEEFIAASLALPQVKWTYDGIHPRPVGHERIARTVAHHVFQVEALAAGQLPPAPPDQRRAWP